MSKTQLTAVRLNQLEDLTDEHSAKIAALIARQRALLVLLAESLEAHYHEDTSTRVEMVKRYKQRLAHLFDIS